MRSAAGKSIWTGRKSDSLIEVEVPGMNRFGGPAPSQKVWVEPEHEEELRRFVDLALRRGRFFLAVMLGGSVVMTAASVLIPVWPWALWGVTGGLAAMGVTIVLCPFATPETVRTIGIRRSVALARVAGVVTVGMAIWVAVLPVGRQGPPAKDGAPPAAHTTE